MKAFSAQRAAHLSSDMRWIEPIWKTLLSNKGILPILWELYPNHEVAARIALRH